MIELLKQLLHNWSDKTDDRAKLQSAFFITIIALVVLAGLVSLLDVDLGRTLLGIASLLGAVFLVNAVAWALLQVFVLSRLARPKPAVPVVRSSKK